MKKLTTTFLAGTAMLSAALLAACSSGTPSDGDASGATDTGYNMTLVPGTKGSPFYEAMACGAQAAGKDNGVAVTVSAPDTWGAASQLPVLDSVAAQDPSALLVVPTDTEALTSRLQSIKDSGSPIVELDQKISDDSVSVSKIGSSDVEGGHVAAKALADLIGGKGKVLIISSPPGTDSQYLRVQGLTEEIQANYPDIQLIGPLMVNNDVTASAGFVTSTLASDPDLAGIFVGNDVNAIGAVTGLGEAGATGKVKVVAYDAADTEVQALKDGTISALVAQDPYGEGYQGVEQALNALTGKEVTPTISIPLTVLTADDQDALTKYLAREGTC